VRGIGSRLLGWGRNNGPSARGDGAREVIGGRSELGKRLATSWLGPDGAGDRERTVVCEEEALQAEITVNERKVAKEEAEAVRDALTLWTDRSRTEGGACGYAVVWRKNGGAWKGHQVHLGCNQEVYDAECAAVARALTTCWSRSSETTSSFKNHDFHGRTGCYQTDADLGGWPWTDLCPAGMTYSGGDWLSGGDSMVSCPRGNRSQ